MVKFKDFNKKKLFQTVLLNQILIENSFLDISEGDDTGDLVKRKEVIELIQNDEYEINNAERYLALLKQSKHPLMLSTYSLSELKNMKLFLLENYDIGFALKKKNGNYNEIVLIINNEKDIKNIGDVLIKSIIKHGGCYLDHFDGFLTSLYSRNGFKEYDRIKYDPKYDNDGSINKKYGKPDVIYRKYKGCK